MATGFNNTLPSQQQAGLGFDTSYDVANSDLFSTDSLITGNACVAQRIARMLITPKGALSAIDPDPNAANWGWDCRQYINAALNPAQSAHAQGNIAGAILLDEEVQQANVNLQLDRQSGRLSIAVNLTASAGPFQFVLNITQVSSTLIFQGSQ